LIRVDSAKVNITPPMAEAKWFRLVGVNIGNESELYPHGDQVQTVEVWTAPDTFADLSNVTINAILTIIDTGLPDGTLYSDAPNAKASAAWRVIARNCPAKREAACRQIIKLWVKSGLLVHETYHHKVVRKAVIGLRVDAAKRPS
jgi:hypothetical protein